MTANERIDAAIDDATTELGRRRMAELQRLRAANAKLVEALEQVVRNYEAGDDQSVDMPAAHAALALAKGEQP